MNLNVGEPLQAKAKDNQPESEDGQDFHSPSSAKALDSTQQEDSDAQLPEHL